MKQVIIGLLRHRQAIRKDIYGFEEKQNYFLEHTKNGDNIWIIYSKNLDIDTLREKYNKVFIVIKDVSLLEELLMYRGIYIAIFINDDLKIINTDLINAYENPEKALRAMLKDGA